jgi:hypothetical protein
MLRHEASDGWTYYTIASVSLVVMLRREASDGWTYNTIASPKAWLSCKKRGYGASVCLE